MNQNVNLNSVIKVTCLSNNSARDCTTLFKHTSFQSYSCSAAFGPALMHRSKGYNVYYSIAIAHFIVWPAFRIRLLKSMIKAMQHTETSIKIAYKWTRKNKCSQDTRPRFQFLHDTEYVNAQKQRKILPQI